MYRKLNLKKGDIIQEEHLAHIEQGIEDAAPMVNVTYAELVALRNEGKLIAGQMYRMTDYETTCTWENTQVAGHPFDLVLTALDNKTLDEKCSAIWSERDTDGYFANSNLPAWDVRYCLDNDKGRFDWAQKGGKTLTADLSQFGLSNSSAYLDGTFELNGTTYTKWNGGVLMGTTVYFLTLNETPKYGDSILLYIVENRAVVGEVPFVSLQTDTAGKGVVYRLIDESENNVLYDFKNIMFKRPLTDGKYDTENGVDTFCYTFCCIDKDTFKIEDQSVKEPIYCYNNKFGRHCSDNVFLTFSGDSCYSNTFEEYCYSNTFENSCHSNTFGDGCHSNTFGDECYYNTFGDFCYSNTFGRKCYSNTFGGNCYSNTFGGNCHSNIFGDICHSNTFGDECSSSTFGDFCYSNTFGRKCYSNTFGEYCYSNIFENSCYSNTFGGNCHSNIFGDYCYSNTFENSCHSNTFGDGCQYNTFGDYCSSSTFGDYCYSNTFGGNCYSNTFINSETASHDNAVQNYHISCVSGAEIQVYRGREYDTYITKDKSGNIVEYTVDDIINK